MMGMTSPEEFEAFILKYQNMVYTHSARLLGDNAEAADISSEVFLKAYERYGELRESSSSGGWLKTVATNLCLNHISRHRSRWKLFSELETETGSFADTLVAGDDPGPLAGHWKELLETALYNLPDAQRIPLVLFHFEDLSYETIAERLKIPLSKVKSDIFRGRKALERILGEDPR